MTGKVKVRFSHVPDGFLVQTDQVDTKIKHEKGIVKLYDRSNSRRILSMHNIAYFTSIAYFEYFKLIQLSFCSFHDRSLYIYALISDEYAVNNVVNDNFNDINKDMFAVIEKVLQHQLLDSFNKVFSQFSYSQLFPL